MPEDEMVQAEHVKVFVSYAHESPQHRSDVLIFTQRLRRLGVAAWVDQFAEVPPPRSWIDWMYQQISEADLVIVVCSQAYYRRALGHEATGVGLGARWEGVIITQELYESDNPNARFVPVVLAPSLTQFVPYFLRGTTIHVVDIEVSASYDKLVTQLLGQPTVTPEPIGVEVFDSSARENTKSNPSGSQNPTRSKSGIPDEVSLIALINVGFLTPQHILDRWASESLRSVGKGFVIGTTTDGTLTIDPTTEGPHFLVGGSSGSGKTVLLRTMISSIALSYPPDEWQMILIDYKGGAAFYGLEQLPHVISMVTDLDKTSSDRFLQMLEAELVRREEVFKLHNVSNMTWLEASGQSTAPPLSRLLIVIDEFASIAREIPELIEGMVRISQIGRSLGIHTVYATQRPSGAVSSSLKANIGTGICLRVLDPADSVDVIGSRESADLPRDPGLAYVSIHSRAPVLVRVADANSAIPNIIDVVKSAFAVTSVASPDKWPLPLPCPPHSEVALWETVARFDKKEAEFGAIVGLKDEPRLLRQTPWIVDISRAGAVLCVGAAQSGKSTWLETLTLAIVESHRDDDWSLLVAVGREASKEAYVGISHLLFPPAESVRTSQLIIRHAAAELSVRVLKSEINEELAAASRGLEVETRPTRLVVVADRLDLLIEQDETGNVLRAAEQLAISGPRNRVHLIATTDLRGSQQSWAKQIPEKLILKLSWPDDVELFGLRAREVGSNQPPGRGVWLSDGAQVQGFKWLP